MATPLVLDSNFFIQAHRAYYPIDIFPIFWSKVKELSISGAIVSIDKVWNELHQNKDELTIWCEENLPEFFFKDTSVVISQYAVVSQWANSKAGHYTAGALTEFLDVNEADAWLVAYASANGNIIVTHETSEPSRKNKVKIPDACIPFGLTCVNTIEMFRMLGQQF